MKKILKSLKRSLYDDIDVSKNEKDVTIQAERKKDSGEKNEAAASVTVTALDRCENDIEIDKREKKLVTAAAEKEVQLPTTDQINKGQPYFWRRKTGNGNCRLFLGGFPDDVTEIKVKNAFEIYGKVVDVVIPLDRDTNKHKRYGFLEFQNEESAKACLEDRFVSVDGKRVEVKMAWARGNPEKGEKSCDKETKETSDLEKFLSGFTDLERSVGSSCTDTESLMGDGEVFYQKIFENYFKAKFFLENLNSQTINDAASSEKVTIQLSNVKEIEKILSGLYVSNNECSSEEDTGDSSSDSEETLSSCGELEYRDSVRSTPPNQAEATPLPKRNEERIVCDLCEWAPSGNSTENFLAHCRTLAHKQKLRERFRIKETPDHPQNKVLTSAKGKTFPKKTNRKIKEQQNRTKQNPDKKLILEEVMSCIETTSEKYIKCKICNKIIPHAPDIRILIANLSHHVQSKKHLAKVNRTEKSAKWTGNAEGKNVRGNVKEKTAPAERTHKTAQNNENSGAGAAKYPKAEFPNRTKHRAKEPLCKSDSASQLDAGLSNAKVKFRCLPCNYFCNRTQTFLAHLTSQLHAANEKQTSSESLYNDLTNCSHCGTLLYGTLDCIKNHITKCKKPK